MDCRPCPQGPRKAVAQTWRPCLIALALASGTTAQAQQILTVPALKAIHRQSNLSPYPYKHLLPGGLPMAFKNGQVAIAEFNNACGAYIIARQDINLKQLPLIPFKRYPTMDAYGVVGNTFPAFSNSASILADDFPQKLYDSGAIIFVRSCGGRADGVELSKQVNASPRPLLPDGRRAFFVDWANYFWQPSWCVFDNEAKRNNQSIPQSGFVCVGMANNNSTSLDILKSIVQTSGNPGR
ncbi:MAG: hypothetical protein ACK6AD_00875 [Cyanobacteriota bacterium]|jgi:hypothetical protein